MPLTLTHIYRHPVKGLTPELLERVTLSPGQGLPHDRQFALAHGSTRFDPAAPEWMPKTNFLMLMRNERLAKLKTQFDDKTGVLTIQRDGKTVATGNLRDDTGRTVIEQFFAAYMESEARGAPRLVEAPSHMFSDTAAKVASIIGLASIRDLERVVRAPIDPRRFRANFYFEGGRAWEEFDWLGREISIGRVRLKIVKQIVRCPATNVDPETAERDMNIPVSLQQGFKHAFMGVYGEILNPGEVVIGNQIAAPSG
jgi:uncharacterized protein